MAYYLDYSAGRLSGATIRAAGYTGAIRYIAAGRASKRTTLDEYRSHLAAGLDIYFVCQSGTADADQGFPRGAELARAAKADADALGYSANRAIFFTNDRTTLPSPVSWRAFLDGAASVLGRARVGAYGFANAIDAAQGHAVAFWQAGRRSDVRPSVNFWQDNNTQVTVGGITCDRNLVLRAMPGEDTNDMDAAQDQRLKNVEEWLQMIATNGFRAFAPGQARNGPGAGGDLSWFQAQLGHYFAEHPVPVQVELDYDRLADLVAQRVSPGVANAVNDEADRRARDGDPATGPVS